MINFMILAFFSIVTGFTIHYVNRNFSARNFLENITYLPLESVRMTVITFVAFFLLLLIIEMRGRKKRMPSLLFAFMEWSFCFA